MIIKRIWSSWILKLLVFPLLTILCLGKVNAETSINNGQQVRALFKATKNKTYPFKKQENSATSIEHNLDLYQKRNVCSLNSYPENSCMQASGTLCEEDIKIAKIAWKYFENNYQPKTGFVNAANSYPSTSMWDTGSSLAATIAARDLELITQKQFDDRIMALLITLNTMKLFNDEAPNKAYNTMTGEMVDYTNKSSPDGIGVSSLDLARLVQWLNILTCKQPKYQIFAQRVIARWNFCRLIKDGQMYGLDKAHSKQIQVLQEGRLGYEQYGGKVFARLGFDQTISKSYINKYASTSEIYGIPITHDSRDAIKYGAHNYVVTESYVMDAMENGIDSENASLIDNIYKVQQKRWERTGQITAVTEDNIDRDPYFVYNTIFVNGGQWNAITDTGVNMNKLKSISTKAAISMAILKPNDYYSKVLMNSVRSAYDADAGWYSGVYESGIGYNKAITANTNGVILQSMLYKLQGSLASSCEKCNKGFDLNDQFLTDTDSLNRCIPSKGRTPDTAKLLSFIVSNKNNTTR